MSNVYFILDVKSGAVKIGKANNIEERISDLQTGNPNLLRVEYFIECKSEEHSFELEKKLHKKFEHLNLIGEWFKYDTDLFNYIINESTKFTAKEKRKPLKISTLYGEKELFGSKNSPSCHFYPNLIAQIMHNFEESVKLKVPFRNMKYPTYGKSLLLPYSDKKDRVFISSKKHEENMELNRFKTTKDEELSLESFFG